jgi:predicted 3-demethylubiquinone-9 3-methyltransferase (glyoxalase superfamily)
MQKITPFLWFDKEAEEAMHFYVSIFKNSKVKGVTHYGEAGPGPAGTVMTASFELNGQEFVALNGGPNFKFTEAISFVVNCETQAENRRVLGEAVCRGKDGSMRLAERQIRAVMANRSHRVAANADGQGP